MKDLIIILLLGFPGLLFAQNDPIQFFMDQHAQKQGVDHIQLQGNLLRLASGGDGILMKIEKVSFLRSENANHIPVSSVKGLVRGLSGNQFEDLIQWQDNGEVGRIMLKEKGQHISDVLLMIDQGEGFLMLHLEGQFNFEDLNDIDLDIDGDSHFQKLPEKRYQLPRA